MESQPALLPAVRCRAFPDEEGTERPRASATDLIEFRASSVDNGEALCPNLCPESQLSAQIDPLAGDRSAFGVTLNRAISSCDLLDSEIPKVWESAVAPLGPDCAHLNR